MNQLDADGAIGLSLPFSSIRNLIGLVGLVNSVHCIVSTGVQTIGTSLTDLIRSTIVLYENWYKGHNQKCEFLVI